MQQLYKEQKKDKNHKKDLTKNPYKVTFLTCNDVFVFHKNMLCRLRSSCLRHDRTMYSMM